MKLSSLLVVCSISLFAQTGPAAGSGAAPEPNRSVSPPATNAATQYNPLQGSVPPQEKITGQLSLTLQDAVQRGLRYNLGLLVGDQSTRAARAEELRARAALLPDLSARVSNTYEQVNLAAFGFSFKFPGINIPSIVGPFNVFDARAYFSQTVMDFTALNNRRSAHESARAADFSLRDTRDIVVQLVASGYLQVIADQARVDEAQSEVNTAQALYQRALDLKNAGLTPAIDALRAQVELQSEQTRLRGDQNDRAKDLLALARLIGIPLEQVFVLTDTIPFAPLNGVNLESAFDQALKNRSDYLASAAQVRAAEASKKAAEDERLPAADINADYGAIGNAPWSSHGTVTLTGSVRVSIFDSGRIRADIEQADSVLQQRKAEEADLRQRIDQQIRDALLDLQTAADQVEVARSSVDLAHQTLTQSQDRFSAGVADNIEVVQAQNAVANAAETYISSVNAHNMAKVALARALGIADQGVREYLGGK